MKKDKDEYSAAYRKGLKVVAIGASTGGPNALDKIVSGIDADLKAVIIVVQHMPQGFTSGLAERFKQKGKLTASEARDGDRLVEGHIFIAPGGWHLEVSSSGKLSLLQSAPEDKFVPCVDITFRSVARYYKEKVLGIILTGMCNDGADGMKAIKDAGGMTIAQDQATSIIFGMPRSAIEKGCVDRVVSLNRIPAIINQFAETEN